MLRPDAADRGFEKSWKSHLYHHRCQLVLCEATRQPKPWCFLSFRVSYVVRTGIVTLWLFNIAMGNGPFIDGLPIKHGDFPWLC